MRYALQRYSVTVKIIAMPEPQSESLLYIYNILYIYNKIYFIPFHFSVDNSTFSYCNAVTL